MRKLLPPRRSVLVFVHTKKTAGISMQIQLAQQYPSALYGAWDVSALRKFKIKRLDDPNQVNRVPNGACISKHWPMDAYKPIEGRSNFVTVFRLPIDRIISHYNFYLKHHPKGVSFQEYIHDPQNINVYTHMIKDRSKLTEVYILERLASCLLASKIIRKPKIRHVNRTKYVYTPTKSELGDFAKLNKEDFDFYLWACDNATDRKKR